MKNSSRTIRIFISSTFKDMHSERDYLVKFVFPELRERCIRKGLNLIDIDLRWGVTEEEAEQGKVLEICLDEIEKCHPFFIGLLGERYGWTPAEYNLPNFSRYNWVREFEKGHSITALEIYQGVLKKKEMRPRAFFYFRDPSFINDVPLSKQGEVKVESLESEKKLLNLKEDIKDTYKLYDIRGHIVENYSCKYQGLKINWSYVKSVHNSELNDEDIQLFEKIAGQDNLIDNVEYELLNEKQRRITDKYSLISLDGLSEFGESVRDDIWKAIEEEYPDNESMLDSLSLERNAHNFFKEKFIEFFVGRQGILADIDQYISNPQFRSPLMIYGDPGTGVSAIIAKIASNYIECDQLNNVILRFAGLTKESTELSTILFSVIEEIKQVFDIEMDNISLNDSDKLADFFGEVLTVAGSKGKLILIIDSLHNLSLKNNPHNLNWLPLILPENIKIILSSSTKDFFISSQRVGIQLFHIDKLTSIEKSEIIQKKLKAYRKELSATQLEMLLNKTDSKYPLYLSLACEEIRIFSNFEEISNRIQILPDKLSDLISQFFVRLENDFDKNTISDILTKISSSISGISEREILNNPILGKNEKNTKVYKSLSSSKSSIKKLTTKMSIYNNMPMNVWLKIFYQLKPYLRNSDPIFNSFTFSNLLFKSVVKKRYLNDPASSKECYHIQSINSTNLILQDTFSDSVNVEYSFIYFYKAEEFERLEFILNGICSAEEKYFNKYRKVFIYFLDWISRNGNEYNLEPFKVLIENLFIHNTKYFVQENTLIDFKLYSLAKIIDGCCNEELNLTVAQVKFAIGDENTIKKINLNLNTDSKINRVLEILIFMSRAISVYNPAFSISILRIIIQKLEEVNRTSAILNIHELLIEVHNYLAKFLLDVNKPEEALESFNIIGMLTANSPNNADNIDLIHSSLIKLNNLGLYYKEKGDNNKAVKCHENALKIIETAKLDKSISIIEQIKNLINLGDIYISANSLETAEIIFKKAETICEKGFPDIKINEQIKLEKSKILNNLGGIHIKTGRPVSGEELFLQAFQLKKYFYLKNPEDLEYKTLLARTFFTLVQIQMAKKDFQAADSLVEEAFKVLSFSAINNQQLNKIFDALQNAKEEIRAHLENTNSSFAAISSNLNSNTSKAYSLEKENDLESLMKKSFKEGNWRSTLQCIYELRDQNRDLPELDFYQAVSMINILESVDVNTVLVINNLIEKIGVTQKSRSADVENLLNLKINDLENKTPSNKISENKKKWKFW